MANGQSSCYHYNREGIDSLIRSYQSDEHPFLKSNSLRFPKLKQSPKEIEELRGALFPNYWSRGQDYDPCRPDLVGRHLSDLGNLLLEGIRPYWYAYANEHSEGKVSELDVETRSIAAVNGLLNLLGDIREKLKLDAKAAIGGDPATEGYTGVIRDYPGFNATLIHRVAHELYKEGVPYYPRALSEVSHSGTGIDIHPGAQIESYFFADHGTGIVIGETARIGRNVRLYQCVTLGAKSLPAKRIEELKQSKAQRHPTIEEGVIIYAGATILGGETVIGRGSVIGGNVWLDHSIPPDSKVFLEMPPHQRIKNGSAGGS